MEKSDLFTVKTVNIDSKNYKLFRAARDGDLATLSSLLDGKDIKESNYLLNTPIEEHDQVTTPMLIAAAYDHFHIVDALLNKYEVNVEQTGTVYVTAGDLVRNVTALFCAASNGNLDMVKHLVRYFRANVNHKAEYNQTAVRAACNNGHLEVVKYLIEHHADIHLRHSFNNSTCLISAVSNNYKNVAEFLISKGADPNIQDDKGMTPLHYAAKNDSTYLTNLLFDAGALYQIQENRGLTPLEIACEKRNDTIVDIFIKKCELNEEEKIRAWELLGASLIWDHSIMMGHYWLTRAMEHRFERETSIIEKLGLINVHSDPVVYGTRPESRSIAQLEDLDYRLNETELTREALLIMERILGENNVLCPEQIMSHLMMEANSFQQNKHYFKCISMYTKALNIKSNTQKSISYNIDKFVSLFAEMQHVSHILDPNLVVNIFEQCLTDLEQEWLKVQFVDYDPVVREAEYNVSANVSSALSLIAILKQLIQEEDGYLDESLLRRYASRLVSLDIKIGHRLGHSLLHFACTSRVSNIPALKSPNFDTVKLLVEKGADINVLDNEGNSPLHIIASYNGQEDSTVYDIMCMFLENGIHIDGRNNEWARPLDLANPVVVDRLKEATRKVPLKCLAAQAIKVYFDCDLKKLLPKSLANFVDRH